MPSRSTVRELSELCPQTPRNQHQEGPRKKRGIARISWDLLRWFGVSCGGKVNGIQEVARSIRVSSTNKITHFSLIEHRLTGRLLPDGPTSRSSREGSPRRRSRRQSG